MATYINNQFRVKRSALQQAMMQKLTHAGIFDAYKDILMISAIVGYINKQYTPIEKVASDGVQIQFFSPIDYDIMDLIAYAHKKEQNIINSDEKYDIFSRYANGGFPILVDRLGIDESEELDVEKVRKLLKRYYKLLLSNGFKITSESLKDDLTI